MFVRTDLNMEYTLAQINISEGRFDIYMYFSATSENSPPPTADEAFAFLRDSINQENITQYVQSATDKPFPSTEEVFFQASDMQNPNPSNSTRNGDNPQSRWGGPSLTVGFGQCRITPCAGGGSLGVPAEKSVAPSALRGHHV
jgi:hypothetical protein